MEFAYSPKVEELRDKALAFLNDEVIPAEPRYQREKLEIPQWETPPVIDELKVRAQAAGLWNLFLPAGEQGLTNLEYAPIAEITGHSPWMMPEALNCSAPDTGNMELLHHFATEPVRDRWLPPLLAGEIRSVYGMTEPAVASSDARNISTRIDVDGDDLVINGRKWWSSGAMSPRCKVAIVMGQSQPDGPPHQQQSMVVVPMDTPGVNIVRSTSVFGYSDSGHGGHAEVEYVNVRVPRENLLGELHGGFALAQARLGPGRIHHAMRLIGMAERAFDLMCERSMVRFPFGKPIAEQGVFQDWVAEARIRIEQVRLLVLKTAWLMDTVGNKGAAIEISAIKVAAPQMATWVIDHAIQSFGGAGVSQDTPLAEMYEQARMLRIADGPDEVHKMSLARRELKRYRPRV
ncbi:acyl-CoA dehydrogenase family protein [Aeromicrobium wangtongii]|uniref:Acyl-CoA dehydrogenase family protein n=1 Tax=Aeromicrobium wangtongii TaxID=2969247 RepID=A0ABY5MAP4_9ACTN|nr:acyl-CoA dehydrogenase family protein [Aeromicrobium wangtongii]MCD9197716.1 acyl-CoA dehydrogenase family protein [Aeromicrobium wangtongii]UUP15200.1 acyl-CoA dehydrogenase family protein [Aeromicrobium wangtongii]